MHPIRPVTVAPSKSTRWAKLLLFAALLISAPGFAHGISAAERQAMIDGGPLRYVGLGASHMLTGYDHLLFLFGVVFVLSGAKDVVRFVSVFTLGHSVTLLGATFAGITADPWLIDAVIAISVIYKGFDNNERFPSYLGLAAPNRLTMVLVFGLIHGFGLSTRLQELPLGESSAEMLARIVAFNVGVELGQVAALLVMTLVLASLRKTTAFARVSRVANDGLMLAGFLLLLMQLHGFLHARSPEEFGFNADGHFHAHQDLQQAAPDVSPHENL